MANFSNTMEFWLSGSRTFFRRFRCGYIVNNFYYNKKIKKACCFKLILIIDLFLAIKWFI